MKDKCPIDPWGRHHWYQTTLAKNFAENARNSNEKKEGVFYSHACACGEWRTGTYDKPKV